MGLNVGKLSHKFLEYYRDWKHFTRVFQQLPHFKSGQTLFHHNFLLIGHSGHKAQKNLVCIWLLKFYPILQFLPLKLHFDTLCESLVAAEKWFWKEETRDPMREKYCSNARGGSFKLHIIKEQYFMFFSFFSSRKEEFNGKSIAVHHVWNFVSAAKLGRIWAKSRWDVWSMSFTNKWVLTD